MRREDHIRTKMAGNFRLMTVGKHAVRLQAHFAEAIGDRRFTPRAAHAGGGVDHRPLIEIQQIAVDQRF